MMKYIYSTLLLFSVLAINANAQIKVTAQPNEKWVWYAPETPELQIVVKDSLLNALKCNLTISVSTDTQVPVCSLTQNLNVAKGDSAVINYKPSITQPGFYRCSVYADGVNVTRMPYNQYAGVEYHDYFNFGYEPENIVSLPDNQPDLKEFWDKAKAELAAIDPHYQMSELKDKSSKFKKYYLVKMLSLGNDTVQAYLTIPTKITAKNKKCPVHIIYMGYNSGVWDLSTDDDQLIEMEVCVRGQALNKPNNKYGEWMVYGLDNPENYYYRGAYMDCIRAIDFICTLPQADQDHIYAEGGSQGGAFTMATAALDNRLKSVAVYITFMSDFPDYFKIVDWPASVVFQKQRELGMSEEQMYKNLSYFDIKNLARWITCPVYMGVGLQDGTCPNHTNFSGFNLVRAPKEYIIYPHYGHHVDYSHWNNAIREWYKKNSK